MNENIQRFRKCWFVVMEDMANPPPLRDFLLSLNRNADPPEIISRAAVDFCMEDGTWNGAELALAAIMSFMGETSTSLPKGGHEQVANDLVNLLGRGMRAADIRAWAARFYC